MKTVALSASTWVVSLGRADLLHGEMRALLALFEQGKIAPVIDCVLPLERAANGYDRIASGKNVGKVVVTVLP